MSVEYSVEQVRAYAEALREALRMHRAGRSTYMSLENAIAAAPDVLTTLAERIKADEGAVAWRWRRHAKDAWHYDQFDSIEEMAAQEMRAKGWDVELLFTYPPAQPAQLWEMKQLACRAHALCNELRLAHPEIPELGDDGVLHEAIHDILRVDTPTAAQAQAARVPTDLADFVRGMHTLELYNASTNEPYFDCNGSDMWCSTEDFAGNDGEKFVRFLFGCAEFVKAQLNDTPPAEPVAQGEAYLAGDAEEVAESLSDDAALVRDAFNDDSEIAENMERAAEILRTAAQPRAVPAEHRSTHVVWRREEWLPCYCAATSDHTIGTEVSAQPAERVVDDREIVGHKSFHTRERGFWHEPLFADEAQALLASAEANDEQRAKVMPDEESAIRLMFEAGQRLKDFGWKDAIYCPKDRSKFLALEFGSTGKHSCIYEGEWPSGSWWIVSDGDMSPSRPVLWKPFAAAPSPGESV